MNVNHLFVHICGTIESRRLSDFGLIYCAGGRGRSRPIKGSEHLKKDQGVRALEKTRQKAPLSVICSGVIRHPIFK
jgi:hypothetical protein